MTGGAAGVGAAEDAAHRGRRQEPGAKRLVLPGDEDDLPFTPRHLLEAIAERTQRALSSNESSRPGTR